MSYWTFTDIFEENGTVPNAFHGGFGLVNFQGLRKPSFYAYQFLNRLGDEELVSNDAESGTTRSKNGMQMLLWSYTPPIRKESDQVFYKKELQTKDFGKVEVKISDVPAGNYRLNVYQIGYQINDVYDDYLKIGSPKNLSRQQVKELSDHNDGKPIESLSVKIDGKRNFNKSLNLRGNDVFMISLEKVK